VEGMWLMLQHPTPDDYVLATGEQHSVREFAEFAFAEIGKKIEWRGNGRDEVGVDAETGDILIEIDERYFRPAEVNSLLGDASKAKATLGWEPKNSFEDLVKEMVRNDIDLAKGAQRAN